MNFILSRSNPGEWISVDDAMPDAGKPVFVASRDGGVFIDLWSHYKHGWDGGCTIITHWMPIEYPKHPKRKERDA